jgi:hypothetical protein
LGSHESLASSYKRIYPPFFKGGDFDKRNEVEPRVKS